MHCLKMLQNYPIGGFFGKDPNAPHYANDTLLLPKVLEKVLGLV